jgi:hypothetical protein
MQLLLTLGIYNLFFLYIQEQPEFEEISLLTYDDKMLKNCLKDTVRDKNNTLLAVAGYNRIKQRKLKLQ